MEERQWEELKFSLLNDYTSLLVGEFPLLSHNPLMVRQGGGL